ncbi:MAG: Wzz/FepE/Etk N-terminal domain-containing protein [Desulfoplanes sp.]|nr:Wzz/FepE/Etk N-terminal domain-containing protein [Desulfoplanes sp.]MDD4648509.1 Wzz/FepE/Etk N-terminal domain-containing protein [Desulfoplanes sp.]
MSDQHEEKNIQYMPVQMMPMEADEDEIDLLELWRTLMHKKWVVMEVTLACILGAVGYAFLATPVYETEAYFLPPSVEDIEELNINDITIIDNKSQYTPEFVYQMFLQNLRSRELRRRFFTEQGMFAALADGDTEAVEDRVFEEDFNEKLVLEKGGEKRDANSLFYSLSFTWKDASRVTDWTNAFVAMVMEYTRDALINDVVTLKKNQIKYLEKTIASKRKSGRNQREDQILRFKEALGIAKELGITTDRLSGSDVQSVNVGIASNARDKATENDAKPVGIYNMSQLYLQGSRTLSAQIKALQNRKSDDPFISGLRGLQEKLDAITTTVIAPEHILVAKIDQPALVPDKPIKPRKVLIVALAGVGGLFLGIFVAFLMAFVQKVKEEEA